MYSVTDTFTTQVVYKESCPARHLTKLVAVATDLKETPGRVVEQVVWDSYGAHVLNIAKICIFKS